MPDAVPRRRTARMFAVVLLAASGGTLAACGKAEPAAPPPIAVDTSTLAGTWQGSLNGSYGFSTTTFTLRADSTLTTESEVAGYCTMNGSWTVAAGRFAAAGSDCGNTKIQLDAPMDKTRLTGTWTASSGRSGTFNVAKR